MTVVGVVVALCGADALAAQDARVPRGTNPTELAVYPSGGQSFDEQQADQEDCYDWATDSMGGWDPYDEYERLDEEGYVEEDRDEDDIGDDVGRGAGIGGMAGFALGAIGPGGPERDIPARRCGQ